MESRATNKTRERQLIALYAKREASTLELLTADFGHWPPKGLEIIHPPEGTVRFKPVIASQFQKSTNWKSLNSYQELFLSFFTAGQADARKERDIHIHEVLGLARIFNKSSDYLANTISHEHLHILQWDDYRSSLASSLQNKRYAIVSQLKETDLFLNYLSDECEFQARLHTILVNAYQQHGIMPANNHELWAALLSQGIEIPASLTKQIDQDLLQKFKTDNDFIEFNSDKQAVREINRLTKSLKEENISEFWLDTVPRIYGDMLELYGDKYGSIRMGHSHNVQFRELFYRNARAVHKGKKTPDDAIKDMHDIVYKMTAPDVKTLFDKVSDRSFYADHGDGFIHIPSSIRENVLNIFHEHPHICLPS